MLHHKNLRVNPSPTFCEVQKRQIMYLPYMRDTFTRAHTRPSARDDRVSCIQVFASNTASKSKFKN